jgi:hypothetical protein
METLVFSRAASLADLERLDRIVAAARQLTGEIENCCEVGGTPSPLARTLNQSARAGRVWNAALSLVDLLRPPPEATGDRDGPVERKKWPRFALWPLERWRHWPQDQLDALCVLNDAVCRTVAGLGWYRALYHEATPLRRRLRRPLPRVWPSLVSDLRRAADALGDCLRQARQGLPESRPPKEPEPGGVSPRDRDDLPDPDDDPQASMCPSDIACKYGVPQEVLRKRLERWRHQNAGGGGKDWFEVQDRGPRQPQFMYRVGAVAEIIRQLQASGERPAKK